MKRVSVFCRTAVEGWHTWPDAPHEHAYLRSSHRHMFGVRVLVEVVDLDRQIEFIQLKHEVQNYAERVMSRDQANPTTYSCELMADYIRRALEELYPKITRMSIIVDEDGENGAMVDWTKDEPIDV